MKSPDDGLDPAEAFEYIEVLTTEGEQCTDVTYLAEMLVVYLHDEVKELSSYDRSSLQALDEYLFKHPQAAAYNTEHLMREFIPALGAYLGQVVIYRLEASWSFREPIMRSVIVTEKSEMQPFRHAYRCLYSGSGMAAFYDQAAQEADSSA